MGVRVVWTLEDWARAVVELPVSGLLRERTVLVPNGRVAHALRRRLIESGAQAALVGTRFLSALELAREIVDAAGEPATLDEHVLGPLLAREAFRSVELARFRREDLLSLPGWDEAFARTLRELELCELSSADLLASRDAHVRDVGRILAQREASEELGTMGALLRRAAMLAPACKSVGAALALVTGFESAAELRFLRALPQVTFARWAVRPEPRELAPQLSWLPGATHERPSERPREPRSEPPRSALATLQARLFGPPGATRAAPDDDTVRIAQYAGVHEEVEAAVGWVVEQVVEHGLPLSEIALVAPSAEPYLPLLGARLAALPWGEGGAPLFFEQGISVLSRADGSRLAQVISALREGLSREALAGLLPVLRGRADVRVRSLSRAWELLNEVPVIGGDRGHPKGGRVWPEAWESAVLRLEGTTPRGGGLDERERAHCRELQRDLAGLAPAIEALTDVLRHVIAGEPLSMVWMWLEAFAEAHLRLPPAQPTVCSLIDEALGFFAEHEEHEPSGLDALDWLAETLAAYRVQDAAFGAPRIYLGTLAGVRGLSFRALRIVGLVEGAVPGAVREDPVLPDAARAALSPWLGSAQKRARAQLAAFDDAVRAARDRLALSAARVSSDGSARQPAAVLLDVIRALQGGRAKRSLERLLEDAASAGRARERALREQLAISRSARLERIARGDLALAEAAESPAVALGALRALRDRMRPGAQDGLLDGVLPRDRVPGLRAARPISASRLATLLACPHRYLYENVLGFREPERPLPAHRLEPMTFGTWLHTIAEDFWREHGAELGARRGDLAQHRTRLRTLALAWLEQLDASYPFANESVASAQREALCGQLDKLLLHDWGDGAPRPFVDVERGFGYDAPCTIETAAGPLHVRGKIDRLDLEPASGTLLVRDLKTGSSKPRRGDEPPDVRVDLQLGLYARVAQVLADAWQLPRRVGVSYVYLRSGEPTRSWLGHDAERLASAVDGWLATAVELLERGAFVRSAQHDEDCRYCPYQAVCGRERERAAVVLEDARVPRRLAQLKGGAP